MHERAHHRYNVDKGSCSAGAGGRGEEGRGNCDTEADKPLADCEEEEGRGMEEAAEAGADTCGG